MRAPSKFSISSKDDYTEYKLRFPLSSEQDFLEAIAFLERILTTEEKNVPFCLAYRSDGTWLALNPELSDFLLSLSPITGLKPIESVEKAMKKVKISDTPDVSTICRLTGPGTFLLMVEKSVCTYSFREADNDDIHAHWKLISPHAPLEPYQYLAFLAGFASLFSFQEEKTS